MDNDFKRNGCHVPSGQDEDRQRDLCDCPFAFLARDRERAAEKADEFSRRDQATGARIAAARVRDRQPEPASLACCNDGYRAPACGVRRVLQQAGRDPEKYMFVEYADVSSVIMNEFEANRLVRHEFAAMIDEGVEERYDIDGIVGLATGPPRS